MKKQQWLKDIIDKEKQGKYCECGERMEHYKTKYSGEGYICPECGYKDERGE